MDDDERDHARKVGEETSLASSLAAETGITLEQARELIALIGTNRNSLVREARLLMKRPRQPPR
ncbi:hypothetical protein [Mesorhizobium amorphae]|uniref:ANTAR domain-containing protein n=1 Tax=Mesorhizobium amorphae CCNWGS0123 TaxID=1082933 RepID=G6YF16_9HYPH|nr:hypothetical protein [Mesorhizobium amorphae]ANT50341.1 hypothetical protein A6B35_10620 [Mesorhizobium amorphae CCNWGS0123]EHH09709.1 hypothetical protein MEA186_22806 [Mesorhizobium amorphae CCNWGS0123]GLR42064.1 hypothetical protein GCM10007880_25800 [Mesorhizobium amorphae]